MPNSRWSIATHRKQLPQAPGCYALYEGDELVYVGSTTNLRERLGGHLAQHRPLIRAYGEPIIDPVNATTHAKFKASRRNGDWLMVEWRLITRLQPRDNRAGITQQRAR